MVAFVNFLINERWWWWWTRFVIDVSTSRRKSSSGLTFVPHIWQTHKGGDMEQEDRQHESRRGELPIEPRMGQALTYWRLQQKSVTSTAVDIIHSSYYIHGSLCESADFCCFMYQPSRSNWIWLCFNSRSEVLFCYISLSLTVVLTVSSQVRCLGYFGQSKH